MNKEHATNRKDLFTNKNVVSSTVCNGWINPVSMTNPDLDSGYDNTDKCLNNCLASGECSSTDVQMSGGFECLDPSNICSN